MLEEIDWSNILPPREETPYRTADGHLKHNLAFGGQSLPPANGPDTWWPIYLAIAENDKLVLLAAHARLAAKSARKTSDEENTYQEAITAMLDVLDCELASGKYTLIERQGDDGQTINHDAPNMPDTTKQLGSLMGTVALGEGVDCQRREQHQRKLAKDFHKRQTKPKPMEVEGEDRLPLSEKSDIFFLLSDVADELETKCCELERNVMLLTIEGLTQVEIGAELNISEDKVQRVLADVRKLMRKTWFR